MTHRFLLRRTPLRRRLTTTRLSSQTLAVLALAGANAIWGGSAAASKIVLAHLPPLTTATLPLSPSSMPFGPF